MRPGWRRHLAALAVALSGCLRLATAASAQEAPAPGGAAAHEGGEHEAPAVEFEVVASSIFQNALAAVRLGRSRSPVMLDMHFYGVETNEIGITGLVFEWRRHGFRLMPGLGWTFGSENRPALSATVRWVYGGRRWFSEGLLAQSLRAQVTEPSHHGGEAEEESVRYAGVFEGHWSGRAGRWELGPMIERVRYREENQWKGGGRGAWRAGRGVKLVSQFLAPDPELRVGLAWER